MKIWKVVEFKLVDLKRRNHHYFNLLKVTQILSHVWLFATSWPVAHQASLSFTIPGACSNSCPSRQWCPPTNSSSVVIFSCLQSFSVSGSFLMTQLFTSDFLPLIYSILLCLQAPKAQRMIPLQHYMDIMILYTLSSCKSFLDFFMALLNYECQVKDLQLERV